MKALPDQLSSAQGAVNIVLFSRERCAFCAIVRSHYLGPLAAERRPRLQVAEVELESRRTLLDWRRRATTHDAFARLYGVRFAPTVLFLGPGGKELAKRIVGLSQDYFGAYLESAIEAALVAEP